MMEDSTKRVRSPQFPFVSLDRCVARAKVFEATYHHHSASVPLAAKIWGYSEKSSGGLQTIGALVSFGLMEDEGSLERRKLKLTPLAMTILKDARQGAAATALKAAALRPKVLAELWNEWGGQRPPDEECVSTLHLDRGFNEDAARRLLQVYDATIRYAGLAESSQESDNQEEPEVERAPVVTAAADKTETIPAAERTKVALMENERVVFSYELGPNQGFRLVATGEVDAEMIAALRTYADLKGGKVVKSGSSADDQ